METFKTKSGKIGRLSNRGDYVVYQTIEEFKRDKEMYNRTKPLPINNISEKFCKEFIKYNFSIQLKKVLKYIEPNYNYGWIETLTGIEHSCIVRTLNGQIVPSVENFYKFLYLIYSYLPDFNIWFLLDKKASMQNKTSKTEPPFMH